MAGILRWGGGLLIAALLLCAAPAAHPATAQDAFITTWETTSTDESITIPTESSSVNYDFEIDWGDGTTETITGDDPDPSYTYNSAGTHTVEITGAFPRIFLDADPGGGGDSNNARKLQSIDQWGSIQWESMASAFAGAANLTYAALDTPDLTNVTDMSEMFASSVSFNGDISEWNVSNVTDMGSMFRDADSFDQDINGWDVSNVNDMSDMFSLTESFNQDIGQWNVSSVTDMANMFGGATSFDQDLGDWNVSNVTTFESFRGGFLEGVELSPQNYDALLIGWEQLDLTDGLTFDAGESQYTSQAESARQAIIENDNWTINDGGLTKIDDPPESVNFTKANAGLTGVVRSSTSIGDVNGDGNQDLLIAGNAGGYSIDTDPIATLYLGDGQGGFTEANAGITAFLDGSTSVADVDGDGHLDLLITGTDSESGPMSTLYLGDGQGGFTEANAGLTGFYGGSTSIADVDGDQDEDLLITGDGGGEGPEPDGKATLYLNQRQGGSPPTAIEFAYPVGSSGPVTEDNDGDGWYNARDFGVSVPARDDKLHLGEDWNAESGGDSDCGLPAYSAAAGTIVYAGEAAPSLGKVVVVRHQLPDGSEVESLYAHLSSITKSSGSVGKREQIGTIGDADGYYPWCHLHFAIRLPSSTDWGNPGPGYASSTDGWTDPSDYIGGSTGAPSGLAAAPGDGTITLSWNSLPADVDGYNVYRFTSPFSDLSDEKKITDSPVGEPSYTDGDVDPGTTYYYRVTAVGNDGTESPSSGQASASLQNLRLLGLEVNQSVQTWENSVPLVEDKKTIVRVHLQNKGEGSTPVNIRLKGTQNGSSLPDSPLDPENSNFEAKSLPDSPEDSVETIHKRRADMSESLNFKLQSGWTKQPVAHWNLRACPGNLLAVNAPHPPKFALKCLS